MTMGSFLRCHRRVPLHSLGRTGNSVWADFPENGLWRGRGGAVWSYFYFLTGRKLSVLLWHFLKKKRMDGPRGEKRTFNHFICVNSRWFQFACVLIGYLCVCGLCR